MKITYHNDGGHGWYAVKRKKLEEMGILNKVSVFSYERGGTPTFDNNEICFNGVGDDSHETFRIKRDHTFLLEETTDNWTKHEQDRWKKQKELFDFTKTNHKPYDLLVTAIKVLYKHHFGDVVQISGDGGSEGFADGTRLVNQTLGYDLYPENLMDKED